MVKKKQKTIRLKKDFKFIDGLLLGIIFTTAIVLLTFTIYVHYEEKGFSTNSEFEDVTEIQEIVKNCENKKRKRQF